MAADPIQQGIALLRRSRRVVAFTGAGVSTPSGIPDFRSAGSGLWERSDPRVVISLSSFQRDPRPFFDWIRPLVRQVRAARPNAAHLALAALEMRGRLIALITQNIDGLHQEAGSRQVLEVHGNLRTMICQRCGSLAQGLPLLAKDEPSVPRCTCGGVFKPDIVFFEEMLPQDVLAAAQEASTRCDLMLVAGSSLEVMPAGRLPLRAAQAGAHVLIVNRDPTALDAAADCVIPGDVATILPQLVAGL